MRGRCRKFELETLRHAFYECETVQPILNTLKGLFRGRGWTGTVTFEKQQYPDLDKGNEATKMIGALGIYCHVVWVGRANQWAGKQFDMKK
jgi:hypothetical protein